MRFYGSLEHCVQGTEEPSIWTRSRLGEPERGRGKAIRAGIARMVPEWERSGAKSLSPCGEKEKGEVKRDWGGNWGGMACQAVRLGSTGTGGCCRRGMERGLERGRRGEGEEPVGAKRKKKVPQLREN